MNRLIFSLFALATSLVAVAQTPQFTRCSVVEEFTGTWCDNCPRGLVGMQRLQQDFGDRCIVIHAHVGSNDPMSIDVYADLLGTMGVPSCKIDRGDFTNPYSGSGTRGTHHYGIDVDFAERLDVPTEAGLDLVATWDEMQRDVVFSATTTFNIDSDDAPYRLIFILLENGLTGEGKKWWQANNCSPEAGDARVTSYKDEDMDFWNNAPYYVTDMVYDHVPVNTKGAKEGIVGSIQAPIVSGQAQVYSDKVTTFRQSVIQDKDSLYAVAMLINTQTGLVVNAAKADIQDYGTDAIRVADANLHARTGNAVYDLVGRRVGSMRAKGIYIINGNKYIVK